jgi:hypothetical protein
VIEQPCEISLFYRRHATAEAIRLTIPPAMLLRGVDVIS